MAQEVTNLTNNILILNVPYLGDKNYPSVSLSPNGQVGDSIILPEAKVAQIDGVENLISKGTISVEVVSGAGTEPAGGKFLEQTHEAIIPLRKNYTPGSDAWPPPVNNQNYTIPLGHYYFKDPANISLEIDTAGGTNFSPVTFGTDYTYFAGTRGSNVSNGGRTPSSFRDTFPDTAFGFSLLTVPPTSAGAWNMKVTWKEKLSLYSPPEPVAIFCDGPNSFSNYNGIEHTGGAGSTALTTVNGITVPVPPSGFQVEFWREKGSSGGSQPGRNERAIVDGPDAGVTLQTPNPVRYIPFIRGTIGEHIFRKDTFYFNNNQKQGRKMYKVCYYDPSNGARTPLSSEVIILYGGIGLREGEKALRGAVPFGTVRVRH